MWQLMTVVFLHWCLICAVQLPKLYLPWLTGKCKLTTKKVNPIYCRIARGWKVKKDLVLGNCKIELFVFHHHFCFMSPKFPKFERSQNICCKILISTKAKEQNYKSEQNGTTLLFILTHCHEISLTLVKLCWILSNFVYYQIISDGFAKFCWNDFKISLNICCILILGIKKAFWAQINPWLHFTHFRTVSSG